MKPPIAILLIFLSGFAEARAQSQNLFHKPQSAEACLYLERPVIFIPATMGTGLVDGTSQQVAWGEFSRKAANGTTVEGLTSLALPMAIGPDLRHLRDGVGPTRALDSVRIEVLPGLNLTAPYYKGTLAHFDSAARSNADIDACAGVHVFAYDWRRSGDENAVSLSDFIARIKGDLVRKGKRPRKFDLIAHSGGTQIARYYLRYGGQYLPKDGTLPKLNPRAQDDFANVVFLGPPNAGTLTGLMATANGHRGHPVLPYYDRAVPGSMPGIYQLIPRARDHVLIDPDSGASLDPLDFQLWVERGWGLANPESDETLAVLLPRVAEPSRRREIALHHLKKCLEQARRYQAALDVQAPKPPGLRMMLVIGDGRRTPATALAYPGKLKRGEYRDGDRTVPSYSAWHLPYYETGSGGRVPAAWDFVYRCGSNHDGVAKEHDCLQAVLRLLGGVRGSSVASKP